MRINRVNVGTDWKFGGGTYPNKKEYDSTRNIDWSTMYPNKDITAKCSHGFEAGPLACRKCTPSKGTKDKTCYRETCVGNNAIYFNKSTKKYYCEECRCQLNRANRADTERLYGRPLCEPDLYCVHFKDSDKETEYYLDYMSARKAFDSVDVGESALFYGWTEKNYYIAEDNYIDWIYSTVKALEDLRRKNPKALKQTAK